jgi:hypothetical protein
MKTVSPGTFNGDDVQAAQWRRALACQWVEKEGLLPRQVVSATVLDDGRVTIVRLALNEQGQPYFDSARSGPVMLPELIITPTTPPPWLEWE